MSPPLLADAPASPGSPGDLQVRYLELEEGLRGELAVPSAPPRGWRRLRKIVESFLRPISKERLEVNGRRWRGLPEHLRTDSQTLGRSHHSCGATHGVLERCNFACTSCYLSREANAAGALQAEEVRHQLDQLRAFLGPQGKAQLTAGEVTLLPRSVLGSYIRYAISIGLDPMVMSHGERFLADPTYLRDLVKEDGLRKISIHIDSTQRGRRSWYRGISEESLHSLRAEYAGLIRRTRKETRARLHAAHTVTVNGGNAHEVPSIVRWVARNADAFRMVSFQPVAQVGRTRDAANPDLTMESLWSSICDGLGASLNPRAMLFGHPECNIVAPVMVATCGDVLAVTETARKDRRWDSSFLRRLLEGIGGFSATGPDRLQSLAGIAGLIPRNLPLLLEAPFYALYRLWGLRREILLLLRSLLQGKRLRIRPLAIVIHKFMDPGELHTALGRERLAACVFNVPVEGEMIPMCQLNATDLRARLVRERVASARGARRTS